MAEVRYPGQIQGFYERDADYVFSCRGCDREFGYGHGKGCPVIAAEKHPHDEAVLAKAERACRARWHRGDVAGGKHG